MLIPKFKPVSRTNVPQAPDWVDKITDPIVEQIKDITQAVQNKLSFGDNFNAELREFAVTDDTWVYLDLRTLRGSPIGCSLLWTELDEYYQFRWRLVDRTRVGIKVKFSVTPAPTGEIKVRILVVGK